MCCNACWNIKQRQHHMNFETIVKILNVKQAVSLSDEPYSSYRSFWDKCTKWRQNDLECCEVTDTPYYYYIFSAQISFYFTHRPAVFELRPIVRQVYQWPHMTLNNTKSKVPYICSTISPESQISLPFDLLSTFASYIPRCDNSTQLTQMTLSCQRSN